MTQNLHRTDAAQAEERLALAPFLESLDATTLGAVQLQDPQGFADQLLAHGLAPSWSAWIGRTNPDWTLPVGLPARLKRERQTAAGYYLLQRLSIRRVTKTLMEAGVPCAVFKGTATRESLYTPPSDRPAADVDMLIPSDQRDAAIRVLCAQGLIFRGKQGSISHEITLFDGPIAIDLHWGLFRPGRSRIDLAPILMQTRRQEGELPLLSNDANLLIMLVHAAITKHLNGRQTKLIRAVDLDRHLRTIRPDWSWILPLIDSAGLKVAAWATLYWVRSLLDTPVDPTVLKYLAPPAVQGRYLSYWIDRRLSARLVSVPGLVQGAFSLALHERPGDVARALLTLARARRAAPTTLDRLRNIADRARIQPR